MREVLNKYKSIILPLILVFVFALCTALTWGKWGHIIYDCFREMIIPEALLEGKVLYRDITNLYPPLGYQFNALLFLIFGNSLNVLYWAGIINSFLILSVLYFLVKKYSSASTAFISVLSIMEIFVFKICASNTTAAWFFPYSYSFIYAFSACLLSLFALVLYKENKKPLYLYLSFLFIGLSTAFKLDFILFMLVPLFCLLKNSILEQKSAKQVLISAACLFAPFVTSILIYLATGGTFSDLQNELNFLINFSKAPSVIAFNKGVMPQAFYPWVLNKVFISFKYFAVIFLVIFLFTAFSLFIVSKFKTLFAKCFWGFVLFWIGFFTVIKHSAFAQYSISTLHTNLNFVSYLATIFAFVIFILKFREHKNLNFVRFFTREEKFYFFMTFCAMLISFRSFASLHISNIGNFIIAVWWICLVYFVLELLPKYFPVIFKKNIIKRTFQLFFILYGLCFAYLYMIDAKQMTYNVLNGKNEVFYGAKEFAPTVNKTVKFINEEIPSNKTFLASEEGLVFNYLTGRKADLKYYALIPHMIDTFGEENVIEDLRKNPPDYFLITNNIYVTEKLGGVFGLHYARKIAGFIVQNYDYIKTIKNLETKEGLEITVFKLKEK